MNRHSILYNASHPLTQLGTLRALAAATTLVLAVGMSGAAQAAGPAAGSAENIPDAATETSVETIATPGVSHYANLVYFSRELADAFASRTWGRDSSASPADPDWFNLRTSGQDQTDTTVIPLRQDGEFDGLMVNFEVKY